jgi:hypothetical protein
MAGFFENALSIKMADTRWYVVLRLIFLARKLYFKKGHVLTPKIDKS